MKVIALSGWKQSGKDTFSDIATSYYAFTRYAFADSLKDGVAKTYNIPREHCDDPRFKEMPIMKYPVISKDAFSRKMHEMMYDSFRGPNGERPITFARKHENPEILTGFKNYDPKGDFDLYWTPRALCILEGSIKRSVNSNHWVQSIANEIKEKGNDAIITDMRFRNEMDQLRQAFQDDLVTIRIERFDTIDTKDPSEHDLDESIFDFVISNKGTLEEYYKEIKRVMEEYLGLCRF